MQRAWIDEGRRKGGVEKMWRGKNKSEERCASVFFFFLQKKSHSGWVGFCCLCRNGGYIKYENISFSSIHSDGIDGEETPSWHTWLQSHGIGMRNWPTREKGHGNRKEGKIGTLTLYSLISFIYWAYILINGFWSMEWRKRVGECLCGHQSYLSLFILGHEQHEEKRERLNWNIHKKMGIVIYFHYHFFFGHVCDSFRCVKCELFHPTLNFIPFLNCFNGVWGFQILLQLAPMSIVI